MILNSHNHTGRDSPETPRREPPLMSPRAPAQPGLAPHATRTPLPVSLHDPESRTPETETRPRHSAPIRIPITARTRRSRAWRPRPAAHHRPSHPTIRNSRTTEAEDSPETPRPSANTTLAPGPPRLRFPVVRPPHRGRCVNTPPDQPITQTAHPSCGPTHCRTAQMRRAPSPHHPP